jgi:peroxiredoxin
LQADLKDIEAAGIQIIGVSYDSVEDLAKFAEKRKISFLPLSDAYLLAHPLRAAARRFQERKRFFPQVAKTRLVGPA